MTYERWMQINYPGDYADKERRAAERQRENRALDMTERFSEWWADETARVRQREVMGLSSMKRVAMGMSEAGKRAAIEAPLRARIAELEAALEGRKHG